MSQRNVEWIVGRLVTDEGLRARFAAAPVALLDELVASGIELTPCERHALAALDPRAAERCARELDPRLVKVDLHGGLGRCQEAPGNREPRVEPSVPEV